MKGWQSKTPAAIPWSVWLDQSRVADATLYPFCLPFLSNGFQLDFAQAITIIIGENGTGKSTLLEGIAALAGYDEAGGGKGYRPCRSFARVRGDGGKARERAARLLAAENHQWLVLSRGKFLFGRALSRCGGP